MHMMRSLDPSAAETALIANFRKIEFGDDTNIVTVSTYLRRAWTAEPLEDTSPGPSGVGRFLHEYSTSDEERQNRWPQNSDLRSLHTPWRDSIYFLWNHVFFDTMKFLRETTPDVGHFRPPSHAVLALSTSAGQQASTTFSIDSEWNVHVLILPAYLAPGVSVSLFKIRGTPGAPEAETLLGTFDGTNPFEIWFLMARTTVRFKVEGAQERSDVLPGVLAIGLCSETTAP